ncbi:MAG TPA: MBL fold metallo-hydrolase [Verrucomicrobiae bacterium]|nr:MBL fold metallo-hydrolase [Verrucomicrobiae bacterium]
MARLEAVDRLEVTILVDNVTDNLSSVPSFVETEMARLWRRGLRLWSGNCMCCAAHGLSCLVTAYRGEQAHCLLFDTGPEEAVFERNVERLAVDLGKVEAMVLSHGHWDHGGGMLRALDLITLANGGRDVPTYMHPGMFRSRALKAPDGSMRPFVDVPSVDQLTKHGAAVVNTTEPQTILDAMFHVSGEIPRLTSFEEGMVGQHRRTEDGKGWEPDPLIMDERSVAVNVRGKGLVVFTACSHAGVVNVLHHARESFPGEAVHAVLGGFHLSGTNERVIPQTVEALRGFDLKVIAAAHCTGWRAVTALSNAFGEAVVPASVGKLYSF